MAIIPLGVFRQRRPESIEIRIVGLEDLYLVLIAVISAVIIIEMNSPLFPGDPVQASPAILRADIEIEFF